MSVMYSPETGFAKERVKWEAERTEMGPGLRPYTYREFPMMLHKAGRPDGGLGAHVIVEQREARSEVQEAQWRSEGFRRTPLEAIELFEKQQFECAALAGERNYEKKNTLSPKAIAEVETAEAQHPGHLASVPVTPIKPRKRRTKES